MSDTDNSFNQQLFQIVSDLWGNLRQDGATAAPQESASAERAEETPAGESARQAQILEEIWQLSDESVDWTEVLTHAEPTDSTSDASLWHLYHGIAERVLHGDTQAYQQALDAARPLDDLLLYAHDFEVSIQDADTLTVSCEAMTERWTPGREDRNRWYLAALAVRMGRDLLALLPVQQVEVRVCRAGLPALQVTFTRTQMQKVHFAFVDPVQFVENCGGCFA